MNDVQAKRTSNAWKHEILHFLIFFGVVFAFVVSEPKHGRKV